jgi:hypothetical protein
LIDEAPSFFAVAAELDRQGQFGFFWLSTIETDRCSSTSMGTETVAGFFAFALRTARVIVKV